MNGWLNKEKCFYIYRHIREDKNEPFYIGRGTGYVRLNIKYFSYRDFYQRAFSSRCRNPIWVAIANKTKYSVEIIYETKSQDDCMSKEKEFISMYGRKDMNNGILSNCSAGGESANEPSEKTRKISAETARKQGLKNAKPIYIYSKEGDFLFCFNHVKKAVDFFEKTHHTEIVKRARTGIRLHGFILSHWFVGDKIYDVSKYVEIGQKRAKNMVEQYCRKTNSILGVYKNMIDAEKKTGINDGTIWRNIVGISKSPKYIWKKADMYNYYFNKIKTQDALYNA